jgi:hypothetical protein
VLRAQRAPSLAESDVIVAVEQYWVFVIGCLIVIGFLVRLLLRERVSLQHSLAFLVFMLGVVVVALFPSLTARLGGLLGFDLPSNFFFALLIGVLILLHVGTVIALSRLEARTIALTQELGLMQEQLSKLTGITPGQRLVPVALPIDAEASSPTEVSARSGRAVATQPGVDTLAKSKS